MNLAIKELLSRILIRNYKFLSVLSEKNKGDENKPDRAIEGKFLLFNSCQNKINTSKSIEGEVHIT